MSLFSLSWFKSQRVKEMEALKIEEQKIKNDILKKQIEERPKCYKSLKLVNDVLTVVMDNGSVISKSGVTVEQFMDAMDSYTYEQLLTAIAEKENTAIEDDDRKQQRLLEGLDVISKSDEFVIEGNSIYLKGISRSLPALLVRRFGEIMEKYPDIYKENEEFISLKRFFMWCCLNPRAEVADDLYDFLDRNSFRITKQGFFAALRNVVSVRPESKDIIDFISNSYQKIKAVWKKKPSDYLVLNANGDYKLQKIMNVTSELKIKEPYIGTVIGNLQELYDDLPNMKENRFTDNHTRSFDIRIGNPVRMNPEQCSWSTRDCAEAGLHFTSDEIHYVGCGDTSVLVLINPMRVVGIGTSKGRCYEYLPIMSVPRDEATEILHDLDFDVLQLDEAYAVNELSNLEDKVKEGFIGETKKHEFNVPKISTKEIKNIASALWALSDIVSDRVVEI